VIHPIGDRVFLRFGGGLPADHDGALLASFDGNNLQTLGVVHEQGIIDGGTVGDAFFSPGADPCCQMNWFVRNWRRVDAKARSLLNQWFDLDLPAPLNPEWQWGTFYWYDDEGLFRHATLPNVIHSWGAWYDEESEQIYVGVGLNDGQQESFSGGVFVTETFGETWRVVADGSQGVGLYRTYDVLGFDDNLYALRNDALGSPCSLAVSEDEGQSWQAVVDAQVACSQRLFVFDDRLLVMAGDGKSVYTVDAAGALRAYGLEDVGFNLLTGPNTMTADEDGNLYVLSRDGGIWRTLNLTTWTRVLSSPVRLLAIAYWAERDQLLVSEWGQNGRVWAVER
jgi:hypothetical protein